MTVLQPPRITGAKTSCSRAGGLRNRGAAAGNGPNHKRKRKGVQLYCPIPHRVLPRHLLLDLNEEGWEGGAEGPEEGGGGCLRVRGSDRQAPKAGARLPLHLDQEDQHPQEVQKGPGHSRMGWTISVETVVASLPWPRPTPRHHLTTSRTPASTFPLTLPTPLPLHLKSDTQPYILESPPLPSLPVSHHPLTPPSPLLLHPSLTILSLPRLSPPPAPPRHG